MTCTGGYTKTLRTSHGDTERLGLECPAPSDGADEGPDQGGHAGLGGRAFGKHMIDNGYGRIINIASMYGLVGSRGTKNSPYAAAKGGVVNLTRALGSEWARYGVNVNAVSPGYFRTEATEGMWELVNQIASDNTPIKRGGRQGEITAPVCFLASDEASYMVGAVIPCDGGYTCI